MKPDRFLLLEPDPLLILQQERVPRLLHVQVAATHVDRSFLVYEVSSCVEARADVASCGTLWTLLQIFAIATFRELALSQIQLISASDSRRI